ncbi:hypothetical protein RM423_23735, partial [Jatrophihabitans sp. DSM 44399]
ELATLQLGPKHLHVLRDHVISEPHGQHLHSVRCCDHRENPRIGYRTPSEQIPLPPSVQRDTVKARTDLTGLLAAYDEQLRTDAETPSAIAVSRQGPLYLVTFPGGRGFITYQNLAGANADTISRLVPQALAHYRANPDIVRVEWKTRGHDVAPSLHETLVDNRFIPDEQESIMVGETQLLAVDVALPKGVTLRTVTAESDVRAMSAMVDEVFGDPASDEMAEALGRSKRGGGTTMMTTRAPRVARRRTSSD